MALRAALAMLCLAACELTPSIDEPIAIVPAPSMTDQEVETLARAGECWNLEFGVPFTLDPYASQQRVEVRYNELVCIGGFSGGQYSAPDQIDICPLDLLQPRVFAGITVQNEGVDMLFVVAVHELGHAAGLLFHADDPHAVMGGNLSLISHAYLYYGDSSSTFAYEDRALFRVAHGDHHGPCSGKVRFVKHGDANGAVPIHCVCVE